MVAIDGKTRRRSFNEPGNKGAIHRASAWATGNQLVLGQYKVDEKSNEITAIPELLKRFEVQKLTMFWLSKRIIKRFMKN